MKSWVAISLSTFMICGCKKTEQTSIRYENDLGDTTGYYFPVKELSDTIDFGKIQADSEWVRSFPVGVGGYVRHSRNIWYSEYLKVMEAPILKDGSKEAIRFTWLRSFNNPVSVTLSKMKDSIVARAVILSGAGGYEPGNIQDSITTILPLSVWDSIQKELVDLDFWNMPSHKASTGTDGAQWILEVSGNNSYKVVDRWSGGEKPFQMVCKRILAIGKIEVRRSEDY